MVSHHPPTQPPFPPVEHAPPPRAHRRRLSKKRSWEFNPWLWAGVVALILALVVGFYLLRDPATPATPATPAAVPIVTTAPSATPVTPAYDLPEGAFAGDGGDDDPLKVYVVGRHIQPGRYTTAGSLDPQTSGHWELLRLRTAGTVPSRVDGEEPVGPQTVTLRAGDILETRGLKPWHLAPEE